MDVTPELKLIFADTRRRNEAPAGARLSEFLLERYPGEQVSPLELYNFIAATLLTEDGQAAVASTWLASYEKMSAASVKEHLRCASWFLFEHSLGSDEWPIYGLAL